MARHQPTQAPAIADRVLDPEETTVLDLLDHLLNRGVMLNADVTMGVAGIDLIYLRLSSLLCAADRVMPGPRGRVRRRRRTRARSLKSRA
jgi:gas vesicle protein GvpA/GvpJ/GvpM family